ncbi:hypothetical protein BH09MYX1_BH09MYX1_03870 [soil metagenome]
MTFERRPWGAPLFAWGRATPAYDAIRMASKLKRLKRRPAPPRNLTRAERLAFRTSKYWLGGYPDLLLQWHPTLNDDVFPYDVSHGSAYEVWWKCDKGPDHEWKALAFSRIRSRGCPFCSGRRVSVTNSLATLAPRTAAEWHPKKNGKATPRGVTQKSGKKVWWLCAQGHSWQAVVRNRSAGRGCPYCSGRRVTEKNQLSKKFPKLAKEWHPSLNGTLKPTEVSYGTTRKVWWQCKRVEEHAWQVSVNIRTNGQSGCPFCAGQKVHRTNCLATQFPAVAAEWHETANGKLTPADVLGTSKARASWRCRTNPRHVWKARVEDRTRSGSGCPSCFALARSTGELYRDRPSFGPGARGGKLRRRAQWRHLFDSPKYAFPKKP